MVSVSFLRRMRPFCRRLVSKGFVKIWGIIFIEVNRFLLWFHIHSSFVRLPSFHLFCQRPADFLSRQFHEMKRRHIHNFGRNGIFPHKTPAGSREGAPPALFRHVDKVNQDQTGNPAQADLAGDFAGCLLV